VVTQDLRVSFGRAPAAGLGAQLSLLVLLWAAGVCLGFAGWLAGAVYALVVWAVLGAALRRSRIRSFGAANGVTLARATLVGCVTAIVAQTFWERESVTALVVIATVALVLDAVDGHVARRTGTTSGLGARFDMEVEAMRYAFVAAGWAVPWLRAPLPGSMAGKTVAAMQGIVLVFAAADVAPRPVGYVAVASALACLCWSFGRDVVWLWRNRQAPALR
jgi:hypothetical protein